MSTHLSRKELKQDNVALKVGEAAEFVASHRSQTVKYVGVAVAVLVIVLGGWFFMSSRKEARQVALSAALNLENVPVGQSPNGGPSFAAPMIKEQAVTKALTDVTVQYPGTDEGHAAAYYLAGRKATEGKLDEAMRLYTDVAANSNADLASLAKLSMSEIYFNTNRPDEAQKLLRDLIANPTAMVSKDQATIALAKGIAGAQPAEARKLLKPIADANSDASQFASTALGELPAQ